MQRVGQVTMCVSPTREMMTKNTIAGASISASPLHLQPIHRNVFRISP